MKNLMKRLAATVFCLALLPLTGCGDDNTDDPLIPPPRGRAGEGGGAAGERPAV